jgi:hypothetical protein
MLLRSESENAGEHKKIRTTENAFFIKWAC